MVPTNDDGECGIAGLAFQKIRIPVESCLIDLLVFGELVAGGPPVCTSEFQDVPGYELTRAVLVELVTDGFAALVGVDREDNLAGVGARCRAHVPPGRGLRFILGRSFDVAVSVIPQGDDVGLDPQLLD